MTIMLNSLRISSVGFARIGRPRKAMAYQFEDSATLGTESNRRPVLALALARGGPFGAGLAWRSPREPSRRRRGLRGRGHGRPRSGRCRPAAAGRWLRGRGGYRRRPLFAAEAVRVMAAGAALVWSNALGGSALFFVPRRRRPRRATAGTRCTARRTEASGPCSPCRLIPGLLRALLTR